VAAVNEGGLETMKFVDQDAVVSIIAKEGKSDNLSEDVDSVY
jgi:protein transport protein SEC24